VGQWRVKKIKKRIVPSPVVTKSDFTIGFSVVDLSERLDFGLDFWS